MRKVDWSKEGKFLECDCERPSVVFESDPVEYDYDGTADHHDKCLD